MKRKGETALMLAIENEYIEIVQELIKRGACADELMSENNNSYKSFILNAFNAILSTNFREGLKRVVGFSLAIN